MSIEKARFISNKNKIEKLEKIRRDKYALLKNFDSKFYNDFEDDNHKHWMEIAILIIATNAYTKYIQDLITSLDKYFLVNNKKRYYIFSDQEIEIKSNNYFKFLKIEHQKFPYPTLYRFEFFSRYIDLIKGDQLIYMDVDSVVKLPIGTEVLTERTVVQHCGFVDKVGSFEENEKSYCYVSPEERINYYGGGFYSLCREEFIKLMLECKLMIENDVSNGIIPVWHDESALNKYMAKNKPTRILSPSYHWPENRPYIYNLWGFKERYECKILLIDKDGEENLK